MYNNLIWVIEHYGYRTLNECYAKPSRWKKEIWEDICQKAVEMGGIPFVVSYNCFMFTAGIRLMDEETGEIYFLYITKTGKVFIKNI